MDKWIRNPENDCDSQINGEYVFEALNNAQRITVVPITVGEAIKLMMTDYRGMVNPGMMKAIIDAWMEMRDGL
jgi:hypothetical protein